MSEIAQINGVPIIVLDFETFYSDKYSLSMLTNEAYVRSPEFQVIMLGIRFPDGRKTVITGTHEEIQSQLDKLDWSMYAVLAHNCMFDGSILAWHFGVNPALWLDTLSMARSMYGNSGNSLMALAKKFDLTDKGSTVFLMKDRRRESLSQWEFQEYAAYCLNDVDLCWQLFQIMNAGWYDSHLADFRGDFPLSEIKIIDIVLRMFTHPTLTLNRAKLRMHLDLVQRRKAELLNRSNADRESLMSNQKFAELLESFGAVSPLKISPTTKKWAYAFAKTDPGMIELLDHPDERVQAIVAARMGVRSTLEETRTQHLLLIEDRGNGNPVLPVPLSYGATITHRLAGTGKLNLQNLPAREVAKGALTIKHCIEAPPGHVLVNSDSKAIEARMLAWLAGEDGLVKAFADGEDVYCGTASVLYGRTITKADVKERFVGKVTMLQCQYQSGGTRLQNSLRIAGVHVSIEEAKEFVDAYRFKHKKIVNMWGMGQIALKYVLEDNAYSFGRNDLIRVEGKKGIRLPNKLYIKFPGIESHTEERGTSYRFKDGQAWKNIYGGSLVEKVTQALSRIIVMRQMSLIARRYRVALSVHDSVLAVVPEGEVTEATEYINQCMRDIPKWAEGCPIDCETTVGSNYGEC